MTSKSDIDHWQLNATVYNDRVEEIHYITDPTKNIRRKPHTRVWQIQQVLGRGGFGEVRLEKNTEDGKERAVKRIPTANTNFSSDDYKKELKALLEFSKPKSREAAVFVEFFGWFRDGRDVFLAMEYVPLGDLETNIKAHSGKIPETEARDITKQILLGLEIIHAESFAHRDLKPQNVLVVHGPPEWWVKLADFGLTKRLTEATAYRTRSGTPSYMAPEIFEYLDTPSEEYTDAVDLWAVGCITYRLVTGVVPFPPGKSLLRYCEDQSLFPYDALLDCEIKGLCPKFIMELLETSPKGRPSASQALNHAWITSDPDARERLGRLQHQTPEAPGLPDLSPSVTVYNATTHDGLKPHGSPLQTGSFHLEPSSETRSISGSNSPTVSNHLMVTPKPLVTSDSEPTAGKVSIEEKAIPVTLVSDSANASSAEDSLATLQLEPNGRSRSLDDKPHAFSTDKKLVASISQDGIARSISDSNIGRRPEDLSQPNQKTSTLSEPTISVTDYNTVSHAGLKSYLRPSSSQTSLSNSGTPAQTGSILFNATSTVTPLHSAAMKGHLKVVKFFAEKGADLTAKTKNGATPLYFAAEGGHLEVVEFLLEKGLDINSTTNFTMTPVHAAAWKGRLEVVKFLVEKGADFTIRDHNDSTPLYAAADNGYIEVIEFLLEKGADFETVNNSGTTPLYFAASRGHLEVVKYLLEKGANHMTANNIGLTPLNIAAKNGRFEVVKLLLEKGADLETITTSGRTPLYLAAWSGKAEMVKFLLEKGANPLTADVEGTTPLNIASELGHLEVARLLLDRGVDIDHNTDAGMTSLCSAAWKGHFELVKLLLERGADPTIANKHGTAPLNAAAQDGHLEIVELLFEWEEALRLSIQ